MTRDGSGGGTWANVSTNLTYTFTGLTNSTSYTFKVRAVNAVGSGAEATVTVTPSSSVTTPSAPLNFIATPGNAQVSLSWIAPASNGGSAITGYQVSSNNGSTWTAEFSNTSHIFYSLSNGTSYTFKVRAVNAAGNGAEATAIATPDPNAGMNGSSSAPFKVYNVETLQRVGKGTGGWTGNWSLSAYYEQIVDITLTANPSGNWVPIGSDSTPFTGSYDGKGHTITGLNINNFGNFCQGMFGRNNGIVKNLGLVNVNISIGSVDNALVGGVAGRNSGTVSNCYVIGNFT